MDKNTVAQRKLAPRLSGFDYLGSHAYFVTCCTSQRRPHFIQEDVVNETLGILAQVSREQGFGVYAYCFMPDHLHFLAIGGEDSSLTKFVKLFKQKSGFMFKSKTSQLLWQRGYYDRVLRRGEGLRDVALYMFGNPVRKGLEEDHGEYQFCGSLLLDMKQKDWWP